MKISSFFSAIFHFFFPAECIGCGKEDFFLCKKCVHKLQPQVHRFSITVPHLQKIWVMGDYHMPLLQKSITSLKFGFSQEIVEEMQPFFKKSFSEISLPENAVFVPVPLHFFRKNTRGFNQSLLLANAFSRITAFPVCDILMRNKNTKPQTKLSGEKRRKNLKNAFSVQKKHRNIPLRKNTPIILVDDVTTTFSTLQECAKILKKAGYKNISAVVVARSM